MYTYIDEEKALLPVAAPSTAPNPRDEPFLVRNRNTIEYCSLALILSLAASQCLVLYGVHKVPFVQPSLALCAFLANLAAGLRLSIPASLPTATLLFIASPYIARPGRLVVTWYLILLCYLVGSTSGALLLLWS